jgi:hypothetical protein
MGNVVPQLNGDVVAQLNGDAVAHLMRVWTLR